MHCSALTISCKLLLAQAMFTVFVLFVITVFIQWGTQSQTLNKHPPRLSAHPAPLRWEQSISTWPQISPLPRPPTKKKKTIISAEEENWLSYLYWLTISKLIVWESWKCWKFPQSFNCNVHVGTKFFHLHNLPPKTLWHYIFTFCWYYLLFCCKINLLLAENGENLISAHLK